tara:strand:- start:3400 stop:4536 length:1137 start_codon:yes stop_codon:yes gene_type:complete
MDHDDGDSNILEDIGELKAIMFQLGSMFAFTNIPRNLMILSILVTLMGVSTMTGGHYGSDNSDWKPIDATVMQTGVDDDHCNNLGSLLGDRCRYSGNFPSVSFTWEIEGETYYSSDFMTYPPNLSTYGQAERWMQDRGMIPGGNITGFVNPDDPSEAVLVRQSWFDLLVHTGDGLFALSCLTCNVIPVLILISSRRFEWAIPKERRKRYKLEYMGGREWNTPIEAKELQAEATRIRLKAMSSDLSDEQFEELTAYSEFMDAESRALDTARDKYVVLLENGQEIQINGRTEGELLQSIGNIEDDSFTVLLSDERQGGKMLRVEHMSQGDHQELVVLRLLNGDELIKEETLDVDKDVALIFTFIRESIRSSSEEGAEWWS